VNYLHDAHDSADLRIRIGAFISHCSMKFHSNPAGRGDEALRRVEQAGAKMISATQLVCALERDWPRKDTVAGFMALCVDMSRGPRWTARNEPPNHGGCLWRQPP
jgi:hypothetical protein